MSVRFNRRGFLRKAAVLASLGAAGRLAAGPTILAADSPNARLGMVLIGCGSRGTTAHLPPCLRERLVAVCDCDRTQSAKALRWIKDNAEKLKLENADLSKVKSFTDYRRMFDEIGKDIDAVVIATPDHQHAPACMMAIERGKHVYCEKPLTHSIHEARVLGEAARKSKVATQMGNQGLGTGGDQALAEYLQAGAIGHVVEVHTWHGFGDRFGGSFPRPPAEPVPAGLDWDLWIGPAPYRDYHKRCHPGYWHGYKDFGTGSLGGWGTHLWDGIDFALKLGFPTSAEVLRMDDASDERFPILTTIRYEFPARGNRPALRLFWYEGSRVKGKKVGPEDDNEDTSGVNRPALAAEIEREYNRKLGGVGTLLVGQKGTIHAGSHGGAPRIVPEERHKEFPVPPQTLPRVKGGIWGDFLRACKDGGPKPISNFADFAGPLLEAMYVGHLALRAGVGKKVEWDGPNMKCTNIPELNQYVRREYRRGWTL
jgi:hypothetical protein